MRKIFTAIISSVLIFHFVAPPLYAALPTPAGVMEKKSGAVMDPKNQYHLPFPGILPDHPLYFLKALRDRILDVLIVDPLRKGEFYLLQADKRLSMGMAYDEKGMGEKADGSIAIAEGFMGQTVQSLMSFKNSGGEVPGSTVDRLEKSMAKHIEVITSIAAKASGSAKQELTAALAKIGELQGEIGKLK